MEINLTATTVFSYSTNSSLDIDPTCPPYHPTPYITEKFWIVLVIGTTVCLCGIVTNLILVAILSKPCFKLSHMVYLQVLAGIDICILCAYIAVFSVSILYDYLNLLHLYVTWVHYVPYLNYIIRVVMLSSTYLIVAATTERFIEVRKIGRGRRHEISPRARKITISAVLLFAMVFRLPVLWEIKLSLNPFCSRNHFNHWQIEQTDLANDPTYRSYYVLYGDSFVRVFGPFFTLCIMNFLIVVRWRSALRHPNGNNNRRSTAKMYGIAVYCNPCVL